MKKKLMLLLVTAFSTIEVDAQESNLAAGGNAFGSGGSSSFSVGQIAYATDTNGSVAQGVQQPYEIYSTIGVQETEIKLEITAYPNPTTDLLTLQTGNHDFTKLKYQLFDMQGKLLEQKQLAGNTTSIEMATLPKSTYFLNVSDDRTSLKTFKIIKN